MSERSSSELNRSRLSLGSARVRHCEGKRAMAEGGASEASKQFQQETDFDVRLIDEGDYVRMENGIVVLRLSKPAGMLTTLGYASLDNVLEILNPDTNRGYWDIVWRTPNGPNIFDTLGGTKYNVIYEAPERVEVSFVRNYNQTNTDLAVPLNIDKRDDEKPRTRAYLSACGIALGFCAQCSVLWRSWSRSCSLASFSFTSRFRLQD
ncbi:hypothetical protein KP509_14G009100 [Ceratopteris richardii]|uniref:Uncharacterized protein n=1 Tax=Ceratopteris richardii TaxID=49495 RepID=A0A8T2TA62_CERRI|nr:hypothetical protein KP509_14G009100 [Ceratopteris richardii]